jgi:ABC-type sugar transport system ATPase subunit
MSMYFQTSFFYPHDTIFSNISYDSHKKIVCLTARILSRKFGVKGKLNYITAILIH